MNNIGTKNECGTCDKKPEYFFLGTGRDPFTGWDQELKVYVCKSCKSKYKDAPGKMYDIPKELFTVVKHLNDNAIEMYNEFLNDNPYIIATDTETTGLNQLTDKPFKIVFGWLKPKEYIKVYTFNPTDKNKKLYLDLVNKQTIKYHFMWNAKFDIGMLLNININLLNLKNIYEGMCIPKLLFSYYDKRIPLALKKFSELYLDKDAKLLQDQISIEYNRLVKDVESKRNQLLKNYTNNKWTATLLNKYSKDPLLEDQIPVGLLFYWSQVKKYTPLPTYQDLIKELLEEYAGNDIILTLQIVNKYFGALINEKSPEYQLQTLIRESELTKVLAVMEKNGMCVDKEYLENSKIKVKKLILDWYNELWKLLGVELHVGQHKELIKWFENNGTPLCNRKLNASDAQDDTLLYTIERLEQINAKDEVKKQNTIRICELIRKLRSYTKWYSTYIINYLSELVEINNQYFIFGGLNSFGTGTGRFSSGWQQFPREGLTNCFCERESKAMCYVSEHLVFKPRAMFKTRYKDGYLGFLDYSQMELRVAAQQTLNIKKPDETFLNAYYNYSNQPNWETIDLHTNSAKKIFKITKEENPKKFKELRNKAKVSNFTILYGGSDYAINQRAYDGNNMKEAKYFYDTFKKVYPGIISFQEWCANQVRTYGYIKNDFGRIYRWVDPTSNWKSVREAGSCMIQGGCADLMKDKMISVHNYLLETKSNIKMINSIHDELQFDIPKDELNKIPKIKQLMEEQKIWSVPIICDIELSKTNWADKKEVKLNEKGELLW